MGYNDPYPKGTSMDEPEYPFEDPGPDDIGYSDPNRYICTDPGCDGIWCPADKHLPEK
jgi:hypothetical protein